MLWLTFRLRKVCYTKKGMACLSKSNEAIFSRIISFIPRAAGDAALQKVSGTVAVLVFIVQHHKRILYA